MNNKVVVEIVEQPAAINERFRYQYEGNSVVLGENGTLHRRTYPAIRLLNYTGCAVVVASCVFADDYRAHPHRLVKTNCAKGVYSYKFHTDKSAPTVVEFKEISIQCCRKTDIEKALTEREMVNVDPFRRGFKHKRDKKADLSALRLCFQVFLKTDKTVILPPVVTNIIRDKKSVSDLIILDISDVTSPTTGGKKIMIFCNKASKDDIKVRFFRENADKAVEWEAWANIRQMHRQSAIAFETPAYRTEDIEEPVAVCLQLVRPSDGLQGIPCYFRYVPDYSNVDYLIKKKKRKFVECETFCQYVQEREEQQRQVPKMDLNIEPDNEWDTVSYGGAASASHAQGQVVQSNLNLNFQGDRHEELQTEPAQSFQQPGYFSQICSPYAPYHQPQMKFSQTQNNRHIQHSHFEPQSKNIRSEYQQLNNLQQQPLNFNFGNVTQIQQQPSLSNYFQQQQEQQQYPHPSEFQQTYTNPVYAELTSAPYPNPSLTYQDSTTQHANQFPSSISYGTNVNESQNLCENNFNADDLIENMSDSFGSLVLQPL